MSKGWSAIRLQVFLAVLWWCCLHGLVATGAQPIQVPSPQKNHSHRLGRALWVWRPTFIEKAEETQHFLDFVQARNIKTIFLFASIKRLPNDPETFRTFLRLAHSRGLGVHALNGEPSWIFPDQRLNAAAFIEAVLRYNAESPAEAQFDAIHLDVEPHALREWKAGKQKEIIPHYLKFLKWSRDQARQGRIPLALDIPIGFNQITFGSSHLTAAVLNLVDEVSVMAYRNRPEDVIKVARPSVEQAAIKGKKVWIGISADPAQLRGVGPEQPAEADLEKLVLQVEAAFLGNQTLLGIAIHDYDRYRRLTPAAALASGGNSMRKFHEPPRH